MDKYFDIEIKLCRMVLRIFGLWPCSEREMNNGVVLRFTLLRVVMLGFCILPQTMQLFDSAGNFDEILEIITNNDIAMLVTLIKMFTMWTNREALDGLLASMAHDWNKIAKIHAEKLIMRKYAKLSHLTSMMLFCVGESSMLAMLVMNSYKLIKESQTFELANANASCERIRPLFLLSKFPYDVQKSPYYEITWIWQFLSTFSGGSTYLAIDGFFVAIVFHLCAQMKLLRMHLKDLLICAEFKRDLQGKYCRNLDVSSIVKRHEHLLWFADTIEYVFNLQFLIQLISSCLTICLTGYQIVLILRRDTIPVLEIIFAVYYYLGLVASLFIYCFFAMILSTESTKLGETIYNSNWYQLSSSDAKLLILIMIRTRRPVELTAGKFVAFSLQLYCTVMKTSGGYLSVLLAVKNKKDDN